MKQEDIDRFIAHNLKNFSVNSTGWDGMIRQMLFEFAIGGWNLEKDVFGKEKFGELRCYTYSENPELNAILRNITVKYQTLSAETCEICGSEGKKRGVDSWETTLCLNHYLDRKSILDIDDNLNIKVRNKIVLNINDIAKAEVHYDLQRLSLYTNKLAVHSIEAKSFSWQEPNYYLLLKTIPLHLFPQDQQKEISELFQHLESCEICGHRAVHRKSCLRCHHDQWNESSLFMEDYGEKSNYIKSCQMDVFTDEDDYEKYFKYDRSFEKSPDHQILFSYHDLREYEKIHF